MKISGLHWKKGQSVDIITERIHKREEEKKELEKQLAIEIKKQSGMEYSVILFFLDYLRMLPNDNEYKRRALVNIFINAIYLYDGYFTMILNAGNRPLSIENIPLDDIEKTFENDDVGCSSNSQLVADAPPEKKISEPERFRGFLAFCEGEMTRELWLFGLSAAKIKIDTQGRAIIK